MAKERVSMRKTKEILRLLFEEKRTHREAAQSVGVSPSIICDCKRRFKATGLSWPLTNEIDDEELEKRLYVSKGTHRSGKAEPDLAYIHKELRRKHVTLYLLWQEYKQAHPEDGFQYSRYCELYLAYRKTLDVTMRQTHKAGDKSFVDWSGDGIEIVNRETGEVTEAPLFVGVLGASGLTFAVAKESRELRHWISCHIEMYEYFGGVTAATIPDYVTGHIIRFMCLRQLCGAGPG